jgi:hypothetical protein
MVAEASVDPTLPADRKPVSVAALQPQGCFALQRIKASVSRLITGDPQPDIEAPTAADIIPVPYYSLYKSVLQPCLSFQTLLSCEMRRQQRQLRA